MSRLQLSVAKVIHPNGSDAQVAAVCLLGSLALIPVALCRPALPTAPALWLMSVQGSTLVSEKCDNLTILSHYITLHDGIV
jgi:hypothetical protein